MPWYKLGAFGSSGSGTGKTSLILPVNVTTLTISTTTSNIILSWEMPDQSEMQIDKFNIYYADASTNPTTLSDFTFYTSVNNTTTSYTITGLNSSKTYKIVVESVSVEGYENASLKGMVEGKLQVVSLSQTGYYFTTSAGRVLYSTNLVNSFEECSLPNNSLAADICARNNKILLITRNGNIYYSQNNNWILAHSTGASINTDKIFQQNDNYVYIKIGNQILCSSNGSAWEVTTSNCPEGTIKIVSGGLFLFGAAYQPIKYSTDKGITWKEYSKNWPTELNTNSCVDLAYFADSYLSGYYALTLGNNLYVRANPSGNWVLFENLSSTYDALNYSQKSKTIILIPENYIYYWGYQTEFAKAIINKNMTQNGGTFYTGISSGYQYDDFADRYIGQTSNSIYSVSANNLSGTATIISNTFPAKNSSEYIQKIVHQST